MKVFLSWSGSGSNQVAQALRHWLPAVIQATRPYYSPDDIAKGARWSSEVAAELQESKIGILCVTRDNLTAPWLMFEAGALAKSLDQSRVIPLLVGVEPTDLSGPLAQFQAARFDRTDVRRMLSVINDQLGEVSLEETVLSAVFEKWWPDLESRISAIEPVAKPMVGGAVRSDRELLEEVLSLVRDGAFRPLRPLASMRRSGELLNLPVEELDLTVRTVNLLRAENIHTVGDLLQRSEYELLRTPNVGRKALNEIDAAIRDIGLKLKAGEGPDAG